MMNHALREPEYLKAATMSIQTALVLSGTVSPGHRLGPHDEV
jgi:hypothetical protein